MFVLVQNGVGEQPKVSENDSWKLHASTCCLLCLDTNRFCQSEGLTSKLLITTLQQIVQAKAGGGRGGQGRKFDEETVKSWV